MLFKARSDSTGSPSFGKTHIDPMKAMLFLKKNKYWIILCLLSLILLLSFFRYKEENTRTTRENSDLSSYSELLRGDLESMLSDMEGVGKCTVLITFSDGGETVYACDEDTSLSDGNSDWKREYVLISSRSEGLILKVHTPSVSGIAVICQGGDSTRVKNDVTEVLSRILGISADRISVKKMSS